ncbi:MAG TPA: NADH-quinone oxidoreductase subunit M [bacterium]|jgi:NADH-quinone oxidoreductase subunit M|nr:NADH-quinone oxidoreductase subunit M [bacterium]
MNAFPILSAIWLAPFVTGLLIMAFVPDTRIQAIKWLSLGASGLSLLLTVWLLAQFDYGRAGQLQFAERFSLVPSLGVEYHLGADGISLLMVVLNSLILFTGVLASWGLKHRGKEFFVLLLLLGGGVFGVFTSFNLYVFFALYEVAVLPMYLLIGIWGTGPKEYSAMKLTLMLMGGSAFLLLGILALYYGSTPHTLDIFELNKAAMAGQFSPGFQKLWFPVLFLGFGVLAALWPLHTWSPDGHASAPTAVSMLHAGVLMKLGAYGCLRVAIFLLPAGAHFWAPLIAVLALVNIVYGSIGAAAQTDLKYVTAYSSVSHMGLVLLGLATLDTLGMNGAVLQMFAHGIMTGTFFALIGMTYGRTHTRLMPKLGGLAQVMPFIAAAYVIAGMAGLGLPGLSSFPAELLVFLGAYFTQDLFFKVVAVIALTSIVFTALYVLRVLQKTFYGPITEPHYKELGDATLVERIPVVILITVMVLVGVYPFPVLRLIDGGLIAVAQTLGSLPR